jgi:predicted 3-demethylubiquinone-9 3-methyltransferase (glyoxalase superfamily)
VRLAKDKYGLSWQIVPTVLVEMLGRQKTSKIRESHESNAANGQN